MKFKSIFLFSFLLCSICLMSSNAFAADSIQWLKSFSKAKEAAQQSNKPILIDFTANWCKPCKVMEKDFWPQPKVIELSKKFVCVKLDYDNESGLARSFGFQSIPVVILTDTWGNLMKFQRRYGGSADSKLIQLMSMFPSDFTEIANWRKAADENSEDFQSLINLAKFYRKQSSFTESNKFVKRVLKAKTIGQNKSAQEDATVILGLNQISLSDFEDARKIFEQCLNELNTESRKI